MTATKEQVKAAIEIIIEIGKIIKYHTENSMLGGIPSGDLYTNLMPYMGFDTYNQIIGKLKNIGVVKETNYLLTWVGPK